MGNKNKTVSFRVNEEKFENLKGISEHKGIPLSRVIRDFVDEFIAHDGKVEIVPEHRDYDDSGPGFDEFPPKVEVPKSLLREHERMELENEHLRDQLQEYKQYVTQLRDQLEETDEPEVVSLEEVDAQVGATLNSD